MKYENFEDFISNLDTDNNAIMQKWVQLSEKKRKASSITLMIILIVDVCIFLMLRSISIFAIVPIFIVDIFIFIISQIVSGNKEIIEFNKEYKEKVIDKMLQNFVDELDYVPLKSLPSHIYDEARYGGHYNRYYSDDYFEGKINNQKIVMADLLVQEETKKKDKDGNETTETTTIFNGLFGKINLDKSINSNLNITRDYGFSLFNKQKLEMDSYEFEKKFNVYTNNNIIAMQLLTADIQEDILTLYDRYKIDFHIIIMHNKMYILFNTGSMFEVFSSKNNPNEVLGKYFDIMKFVYKLVNKLLNTIESTQI